MYDKNMDILSRYILYTIEYDVINSQQFYQNKTI